MNNKKFKILQGAFFALALILLIGSTVYAYFYYTEESGENTVSTGSIQLIYQEPENALALEPTDVLSDADGKIQSEYFPFYVQASATGTIDLAYYIYLTTDDTNTLENNVVKVHLSKVTNENDAISTETEVLPATLVSDLISFDLNTLAYSASAKTRLLYSNTYNFQENAANQTHYYRLRLWLDEEFNISDEIEITHSGTDNSEHHAVLNAKTFKMKVSVYGHNGQKVTITK